MELFWMILSSLHTLVEDSLWTGFLLVGSWCLGLFPAVDVTCVMFVCVFVCCSCCIRVVRALGELQFDTWVMLSLERFPLEFSLYKGFISQMLNYSWTQVHVPTIVGNRRIYDLENTFLRNPKKYWGIICEARLSGLYMLPKRFVAMNRLD